MQDLIIFVCVIGVAVSIMYIASSIKERISKWLAYKKPMATWGNNHDNT